MLQMNDVYKLCLIVLISFTAVPSFSQEVRVNFSVTNTAGIATPSATISINQAKFKADSLGRAVVLLRKGHYTVNISSVNHYPSAFDFEASRDTLLPVVLRLRESLLGNVTVTASRNVTRNQMGVQNIGGAQLRKIPVILGEV